MPRSKIDYLKFRTKSTSYRVAETIRPYLIAPDCLSLGVETRGKDGWETRRTLMMEDVQIAVMDYGGESQKEWLRFEMTGAGCDWVADWDGVSSMVKQLTMAELKRVDIALDFTDGSMTHERVLQAYQDGRFKREGAGRMPKMKKVEGSDLTDGRTVYVGTRTSSKFLRCYEKGWEMLSKIGLPEMFKKTGVLVDFENGAGRIPPEHYYRLEAELKAVDGVVLPWTMLSDPDPFFAGAAPFFEDVIQVAPKRALTMPAEFEARASLAASIEHCRIAYGGLLRTMMQVYGDSTEMKAKLFDDLCGNKPSEKLTKAGVFLVNHE